MDPIDEKQTRQRDRERREDLVKKRDEFLKSKSLELADMKAKTSILSKTTQIPAPIEEKVEKKVTFSPNVEEHFEPIIQKSLPGWDIDESSGKFDIPSNTKPKFKTVPVQSLKRERPFEYHTVVYEDDEDIPRILEKKSKLSSTEDETFSPYIKTIASNALYLVGVVLLFGFKTFMFEMVSKHNAQRAKSRADESTTIHMAGEKSALPISSTPPQLTPIRPRNSSSKPSGATTELKTFFR